ncbi:MAG: hypothetical protein AAFR05_09520 [Bacteroidota bacterium]
MKKVNQAYRFRRTALVAAMLWLSHLSLSAQDFMMQGWYWDYPKTCDGFNWAGTLAGQASDLGQAGFTYLWLPPMSRASFGSCSNGYDPQDLYDLGEYGGGATGFGTRGDVDALVSILDNNGVRAVADVVYNHRDGGAPEVNGPVKDYITIHYDATKNPFPSDRFRCVLPLGGSSGNNAGDYYFKISSKSQSSRFHNKAYTLRMETSLVANQGTSQMEVEPNGGGDCGETFNDISLGVQVTANVDALGCTVDEFKLTLSTADFAAAGDELVIYLTNPNGDYSDHRVYGIWNATAAADVVGQLDYETYTDFMGMPSGQGGMNFENFRPNSTNTASTRLDGDWDWLWFFYDYDQNNTSTRDELFAWTKWLWDDVNIRGFRMDAVKHFDPAFIGDLLDYLHGQSIDPGLVVGEVFDGNPVTLQNWVASVQANMDGATLSNIDVRVFDFALRNSLKSACDAFGYDARQVFNSGIVDGVGGSGFNTVTFVNNHDFRGPGEPVQNDPMLAYAYVLTNNRVGLPAVFYPDYYGVSIPNAPTNTLKPQIDQLMMIHQQYIFGANSVDYLSRFGTPYSATYSSGFDNTTLFYQISGGIGGKEVLVAINFAGEPLVLDHEINVGNLGPGVTFEEQTGNATTGNPVGLNGANQLRIQIPARSYAVYVESAVPVPVDLVHFTARPDVQQNVEVDWEVAREAALDYYLVERSVDGQLFAPIEQLPSRGEDQLGTQYHYLDRAALRGGTNYYRLRMVDRSGEVAYSPVREVALGLETPRLRFQPNPVREGGTIAWEQEKRETVHLACYHAAGQLLWERVLDRDAGAQQMDLVTAEWPAGVYYLKLRRAGREWVEKIVKW